jgi:hypothetical protein
MLNLKRGPQDPILPIRAAKHPRTTALYADRPTASQNEGLLSQWISSLVNLTTRAASGVFTEGLLLDCVSFLPAPFAELPHSFKSPPTSAVLLSLTKHGGSTSQIYIRPTNFSTLYAFPSWATPQNAIKNPAAVGFAKPTRFTPTALRSHLRTTRSIRVAISTASGVQDSRSLHFNAYHTHDPSSAWDETIPRGFVSLSRTSFYSRPGSIETYF